MKHISKVPMLFLVLIFALVTVGAVPQVQAVEKSVSQAAIFNYLTAQKNSDISDEEKIKAAIEAYFVTRYEGQKLGEMQDFSTVLENDTLDWVKKEKDKREIELHISTLFDLSYQNYKFSLGYDSIEIKEDQAIVQLRESHEVVFTSIAPEVSKLSDLQHIFTLHKKGGVWVIHTDEYQDELSIGMEYHSKEELINQVDQNYQEDIERQHRTSNPAKVHASLIARPLLLTNYTYNRTTAKTYADNYWASYNTTYYKTEASTDCASYVSQAIYAGEGKTPPDTSGMGYGGNYTYDWYYVFNNPAGTQNGSGSLPWIQVQAQYNFIIGNTNRIGPYGAAATFADTSIGDIAQIKQGTAYDHEGIIVVLGPTLSTELVNAHTTNRWHYPLSNWSAFSLRYITIFGWKG